MKNDDVLNQMMMFLLKKLTALKRVAVLKFAMGTQVDAGYIYSDSVIPYTYYVIDIFPKIFFHSLA